MIDGLALGRLTGKSSMLKGEKRGETEKRTRELLSLFNSISKSRH
jgi:hypothetical protein